MSASDCWRSCCCFSARERLDWIRERGDEVPEELAEAVEREDRANVEEQPAQQAPSCCSGGGHKPHCSKTKPAADSTACCSKKPTSVKTPRSNAWGWILGVSAKKCRGIEDHSASGELGNVPAPPHVLDLNPTPIDVVAPRQQFAHAVARPIDSPPPRFPFSR